MSLSGNLGFVPIDEVLRLLTRSHQQGSVNVTGNSLFGRVFVGEGGIDLATTSDDEDLYRHLVNSGFAEESALRRVTSRETTLPAIADNNQPMIDLIREMTVESLYQIAFRGEEFEVEENSTTPYASPRSFELEALLADARERGKEWSKVSEIVPDLTDPISFRRDLGEREEVTVKVDEWKVLAEIGTGASASEIADRLGTTDFWTARVAARLIQGDLIDLRTSMVSGAESTVEAEYDAEPEVEATGDTYADDGYEVVEERAVDEEVADEASVVEATDEHDPNESWWREPEDEEPRVSGEPETPGVVGEGLSQMPSASDDSDVEEDTEAFLEKVFSELESSDSEGEDDSQEGHGLLRRRRLGTLRDFSSDS